MVDYVSQAVLTDGKKAWRVFEELNTIINLVVGGINTIAGKSMSDAIERVKVTGYFRHDVKSNLNKCVKMYFDYEKRHLTNFENNKRLFLDYLDYVENNIQKDVDIFRISIKSLLDKYGETESELKSYVEAARTLLNLACHIYDAQIDVAREKAPTIDYNSYMYPARLTGVAKHFENAADVICKTRKDVVIDLNEDKNCVLAFRTIQAKITSEDFINKAGYEALKLNPENIAQVSLEDFKILEDKYGKFEYNA